LFQRVTASEIFALVSDSMPSGHEFRHPLVGQISLAYDANG